jgi:hypothetical protein
MEYDTMKSGRSLLNKLVARRVKFSFHVASCALLGLLFGPEDSSSSSSEV